MDDFSAQQYDEDEVGRIIRRALKIKKTDTISYQDLLDTAREFGLDASTIDAAIREEQKAQEKERIQKIRFRRRRAGFLWHLYSYIFANVALIIVNSLAPGPWWFQWSVLGWGIGLAFHYKATFLHKRNRNNTVGSI